VLFDQDAQGMGGGAVERQASGHAQGDLPTDFGVVGAVQRLPRIVQQQGQMKDEGPFDAAEDFRVVAEVGVLRFPHLVELSQAHQGVFVRGVLMIELVLHQAG